MGEVTESDAIVSDENGEGYRSLEVDKTGGRCSFLEAIRGWI